MTSRWTARAVSELEAIGAVLHDAFFDLPEAGEFAIPVPLLLTGNLAPELRAFRVGSVSRTPDLPQFTLRIGEARHVRVHDEAQVGSFDLNRLTYDDQDKALHLIGNIPVDVTVGVERLDLVLEVNDPSRQPPRERHAARVLELLDVATGAAAKSGRVVVIDLDRGVEASDVHIQPPRGTGMPLLLSLDLDDLLIQFPNDARREHLVDRPSTWGKALLDVEEWVRAVVEGRVSQRVGWSVAGGRVVRTTIRGRRHSITSRSGSWPFLSRGTQEVRYEGYPLQRSDLTS